MPSFLLMIIINVFMIRPHQSTTTVGVAWSYLSVCLLVMVMSPAKMAELIMMLFGGVDLGEPKQPPIDSPDRQCEEAILRGKGAAHCKV